MLFIWQRAGRVVQSQSKAPCVTLGCEIRVGSKSNSRNGAIAGPVELMVMSSAAPSPSVTVIAAGVSCTATSARSKTEIAAFASLLPLFRSYGEL